MVNDREPRYRLVSDDGETIIGSWFEAEDGSIVIEHSSGQTIVIGSTEVTIDGKESPYATETELADKADSPHGNEEHSEDFIETISTEDSGTAVVDTTTLNFGENLTVTDSAGTATIDASGDGAGDGTSDTASVTGDGTTTIFTLPHSHGKTPEAAQVQPESTTAADANFWVSSKRSDEVDVEYKSAPASDTLAFNLWLAGEVAIPDREIYLHDDWEDNKLTDRDDSGTTTHNNVEGVYRPEWTVDAGEPVAQNEQLEIREGDALYSDININLDEPLTVEWDANNLPDGSGADHIYLGVWSESLTFRDDEFQEYQESYSLRVRGEGNIVLRRIDGDGDSTTLISGSHSGADDNIKLTRDVDGNWELFVNDESQGTAQDDTLTDPQYATFAARDSASPEADINEVKWS